MYEIIIYENSRGKSEILDLLQELNDRAKTDKRSRVRLKKIAEYILLDNHIILLHHFVKKSSKTPRKEIEKAKLNLYDFLEREGEYYVKTMG